MAKFKVGDKVNHFAKGDGFVVKYDIDPKTAYPIKVSFANEDYTFTSEGRLYEEEEVSLRLTGRPFNVGDKVVIGGEKGVVCSNKDEGHVTGIRISMLRSNGIGDSLWITTDGRAWPGTPIIAEHDWEEGIETVAEKMESAINNIGEAAKNCGVLGNWPVDDMTVSPEEVRHIAEMQDIAEMQHKKMMEVDALKDQHNYARMALVLVGIGIELKAAALVTEIVKRILELGGEFSLDTAREVEARVNEIYNDEKA